jgi:hypothetical protein
MQDIFKYFALQLSKVHIKVASSTTANAVNQLANLIKQQDLSRLVEFTNLNLNSPTKSNELKVHSALADTSNGEAMRLQSIKQIMTTLINLEEEVNE